MLLMSMTTINVFMKCLLSESCLSFKDISQKYNLIICTLYFSGLAYLNGVCKNIRYSINEEKFTANVATVASHELGHK